MTYYVGLRLDAGLVLASDSRTNAGVDLLTVNYLFEAAGYAGQVSVRVQEEFGPALRQVGAAVEATFILGGQIVGQAPELYLIYPPGNSIMATADTPYLQIGESKY